VRSCQKFPLCPMEPMPAGSKMDLPLAKAKPISGSGSTSDDNIFKKGENKQHK